MSVHSGAQVRRPMIAAHPRTAIARHMSDTELEPYLTRISVRFRHGGPLRSWHEHTEGFASTASDCLEHRVA